MKKMTSVIMLLTALTLVIFSFQNCAIPATDSQAVSGPRELMGQGSNGQAYYTVEAPNSACIDLYKENEKIFSCQHNYEFIYSNTMIDSGTGAYGRLLTLNGVLLHEGYHSVTCSNISTCSADCTFMTGATSTGPLTLNICQ